MTCLYKQVFASSLKYTRLRFRLFLHCVQLPHRSKKQTPANINAAKMEPLGILKVADSVFLGYAQKGLSKEEAIQFQNSLKQQHKDAGHVSVCWSSSDDVWFDEDDEPPETCGPMIHSAMIELEIHSKESVMTVVIVRYFGGTLLGILCGRLQQVYKGISYLTLHRFLKGRDEPLIQEFANSKQNLYGLAAGDTELIVNVVTDAQGDLAEQVRNELKFDGFKDAKNAVLPRLQNLQANLSSSGGIIPVYRYPGNYSGTEWETYDWCPKSLEIKRAVEDALLPLRKQEMNHCVTNLYRANTQDCIDHHSDKDLDLNPDGVIVSVSLGDERVMELRRRAHPHDLVRISLPHCSMLVLGPNTNQEFTHAILPKFDSTKYRISLTMRNVTTYLDTRTGRLFGQGAAFHKTLDDARNAHLQELGLYVGAFLAVSAAIMSCRSSKHTTPATAATLIATFASTSWIFQKVRSKVRSSEEECIARDHFSIKSASGTKY